MILYKLNFLLPIYEDELEDGEKVLKDYEYWEATAHFIPKVGEEIAFDEWETDYEVERIIHVFDKDKGAYQHTDIFLTN